MKRNKNKLGKMKKLNMIAYIKKQDVFYAGVSFKGHTMEQVEKIYMKIKAEKQPQAKRKAEARR